MNEIDVLKSLPPGDDGSPPRLEVAGQVLDRIRLRRRGVDPLLLALPIISSVAAAITVALAVRAWLDFTDPLNELFQPLVMVMQ